METSIIEQLDNARYSYLKWSTIGWAIWFGTFIITDLIHFPEVSEYFGWIRLLGWLILIISTIRFLKLKRELKWDKKMKNALEGELHQFNLGKSFQIGFYVVMGITLGFLGISLFFTITALLVTKITLYFGVLSVTIAKISYNRD